MVQRSWSNAAAKLAKNPCVPVASSAPYFNSFPALDLVSWGADKYVTRGVSVPVGFRQDERRLQLYSAAPTKGTWTVSALDYDAWVLGATPKLGLSLDKNEGKNGDILHLTITPKAINTTLGAEVFILVSHAGGLRDPDYQTNLTMGVVTN